MDDAAPAPVSTQTTRRRRGRAALLLLLLLLCVRRQVVVIGCLRGAFYKLAWRPRWLGPWVGLLVGKTRLCVAGGRVCLSAAASWVTVATGGRDRNLADDCDCYCRGVPSIWAFEGHAKTRQPERRPLPRCCPHQPTRGDTALSPSVAVYKISRVAVVSNSLSWSMETKPLGRARATRPMGLASCTA